MRPGDVLPADRGFCSYAHLVLLFQAGIHGVFRIHQRTIVSFEKCELMWERGRVGLNESHPKVSRDRAGLNGSQADQIAELFKPK